MRSEAQKRALRNYVKRHPDRVRARYLRWKADNPDYGRLWKKAHPGYAKKASAKWYAKVRLTKKFKVRAYERYLTSKHGLGAVEHYHEAKVRQKGRCNICRKKRKLVFEHCHKTGKKRPLTCQQCNSGMGMFKDNPKLLTRAIAHLKGKLK